MGWQSSRSPPETAFKWQRRMLCGHIWTLSTVGPLSTWPPLSPLPATLDFLPFVHSHFVYHYLVALQVAIIKIKGPKGWPVDLPDPHEHIGCTTIGKWRKWMTQWVIRRDLCLNDSITILDAIIHVMRKECSGMSSAHWDRMLTDSLTHCQLVV